jgi:hypothetical protein
MGTIVPGRLGASRIRHFEPKCRVVPGVRSFRDPSEVSHPALGWFAPLRCAREHGVPELVDAEGGRKFIGPTDPEGEIDLRFTVRRASDETTLGVDRHGCQKGE